MNAAQSIAAISEWLAKSSVGTAAPLFGVIERDAYAVLAPVAFDEALPEFAAGSLPLFVPQSQAGELPILPALGAGVGQPPVSDRAEHLLWMLQGGRYTAAMVALDSPSDTLGAAIERSGMSGLDLTATALLALPMWALSADARSVVDRKLPYRP